ncbi:bifunctional tRNA (mnm(5)s(2)U34)-methyltransferase/FAD-dependent cmnm(5)s(2)U34 oxidoreductase [compost metagenome]
MHSVIGESSVTQDKLKIFLRHHFKNLNSIDGALNAGDCFDGDYSGILYDAFSSKTTPHLWEEEFLKSFFQCAAADAMVSTYACKATLKRALKDSGFEVIVREGFLGKRNSTLALRGQLRNA